LFALKLMIGVVVGTYSSIFVASPALLAWHTSARARQKRKDAERYHKGAVSKNADAADAGNTATPKQVAASADADAVRREIAKKRSAKKTKKGR
jgi:preprotein translocase subunit SecF